MQKLAGFSARKYQKTWGPVVVGISVEKALSVSAGVGLLILMFKKIPLTHL